VALQLGLVTTYLSLVVLIPLAAVVVKATDLGWDAFWNAVTAPQAIDALKLTLGVSLLVAAINALAGTLIAWVLVRDSFRGKGFVNSLIDLPFALPTIVAGLTLLALYGPKTPVGIDVAYTRTAVVLALLFVTLPFVVRAVQPVLMELDKEMEEASASLGASNLTTFRRVILPNLLPAILAGVGLAFARAVGEFGSLVLISGNLPFKTEVASVFIFSQIESDRVESAAAVSVVLLAISLVVLLGISALSAWGKRGLIEESGRSQFGAILYRTTNLFQKLFGLSGLDALPDPAAWDPSPEDEADLRERLLKAGEQRAATT
jgi:sulfate transport system permease protein